MTRATRNAAMVRTYGRDSWSQTPPQTEAMRQHHHGPLLPMDDKLPGDGSQVRLGALICLASAAATIFTLVRIFS